MPPKPLARVLSWLGGHLWGVLAPGWIAGQFAAALRRGTRQEIVAAGSRSFHRARAFAEEHGAPTAYGSYDELVHDPQVDIVYIASPHSEHHRQARLALKAGKPVLVEKAFTRNPTEARDLIDLAHARGLFLLEGMWSRFLPHYDVLQQAVPGGSIGDVTTVFADHGQHLYPTAPTGCPTPTSQAARCSTSPSSAVTMNVHRVGDTPCGVRRSPSC